MVRVGRNPDSREKCKSWSASKNKKIRKFFSFGHLYNTTILTFFQDLSLYLHWAKLLEHPKKSLNRKQLQTGSSFIQEEFATEKNNLISFRSFQLSTEKKRQEFIQRIQACSKETEKYGITISESTAIELCKARENALTQTKRSEWGSGVMDKIILEFSDSPYINQGNFEETMNRLLEVFYLFKNEANDMIPDLRAIEFMYIGFNWKYQGDVEALAGDIVDYAEKIRRRIIFPYWERHMYLKYRSNESFWNVFELEAIQEILNEEQPDYDNPNWN